MEKAQEKSNVNSDLVICKSNEKVDGWVGHASNDYVRFTAYIVDNKTLFRPQIQGAFGADYSATENLSADREDPKYPDTIRFFGLEDAWCWFGLIAPKDFNSKEDDFKASIQYTCEDWGYSFNYIPMSCFIKKN